MSTDVADRDDQTTAGFELFDLRWRNSFGHRRHDDRIEGSLVKPALPAVSGPDRDIGAPQFPEPLFGLYRQFRNELHRENMIGKTGEHRRLVTGPGADFEHAVGRLNIQQVRHQRDNVRLGYGLPVTDRKRPVLIGQSRIVRSGEFVARDCRYRRHNRRRKRAPAGPMLRGYRILLNLP